MGTITARDLSSGSAPITDCDTSFGHSFTTSGGLVTQVTVSDIAAQCVGGQLSVRLTNSAGSSIGAGGPVTVSVTSAAVPISAPQPSGPSVAEIHIIVVGP